MLKINLLGFGFGRSMSTSILDIDLLSIFGLYEIYGDIFKIQNEEEMSLCFDYILCSSQHKTDGSTNWLLRY